ncbi:MAG: carbon starvation protein A [Candidatus Hydrogenedentota bacterium]
MTTILIALVSFVAFFAAYHTYGRFVARKIFQLDPARIVPSHEVNDGIDYVPTRKSVVFGHHFTSIAGTGPIVGPALAVFWGWLPALLWVVFGCIFIGAVHDLGALVVSLRSRGMTIGDVAGRMINNRARLLFLLVLFFTLMIVIGIFGLVIALIFAQYPESVLSVWLAMPLAVGIGLWIRRTTGSIAVPTVAALALLYGAVALGVYVLPIDLGALLGIENLAGADMSYLQGLGTTVVIWTVLLLVYCFVASVLPVWLLLQPRDYINSYQLFVALGLLVLGLVWARPEMVAPMVQTRVEGAPPILPFLFITIACGAISGFHSLVSSGTSSKQVNSETDAQYVAYGGMLFEGVLAVLVILACCAGIGIGRDGLAGNEAWQAVYHSWSGMTLGDKVGAFVDGSANMIVSLGVPLELATAVIAVMVACFAATTLDTATRLQRYIIQELGGALRMPAITNKYTATTIAVVTGGVLALIPSAVGGPGTGGMILWPLFGTTNQLLAGLAFLVVAFYLIRHRRPVWFLMAPLALMVVLPAWAMAHQLATFYEQSNYLLVAMTIFIFVMQIWMVVEGVLMWRGARGMLPAPLPPLAHASASGLPAEAANNVASGPEFDTTHIC